MPELPEVETMVRRFRPGLAGRRILGFVSRWSRQASPSVAKIRRALVGATIQTLRRRGKYIVFVLEPRGFLLVHLRMSGRLEWGADHQPQPAHVRTVWELDDGRRLLLCDARKFARIIHADDLASVTAGLGVEPLDRRFTPATLQALLRARGRRLKPLLLDQSVIAGLGNIYADESLFRAGLHPLTRSDRVSPGQLVALHGAIRAVLREAIRRCGTSFDWAYPGGRMQHYLRVYGRSGQPCYLCGTTVQYLKVGQRGTHICPRCQNSAVSTRRVSRRQRRRTSRSGVFP